jgi:hypothetical protein
VLYDHEYMKLGDKYATLFAYDPTKCNALSLGKIRRSSKNMHQHGNTSPPKFIC